MTQSKDLHCSQRNRGMLKSGSRSTFSSLFILFCLDLDLGFHSVLSLIKSPFASPYKPASLRMITFTKKKMRIVVLGNLRVTSQPSLTNAEIYHKILVQQCTSFLQKKTYSRREIMLKRINTFSECNSKKKNSKTQNIF